jgi:hypothetical protein
MNANLATVNTLQGIFKIYLKIDIYSSIPIFSASIFLARYEFSISNFSSLSDIFSAPQKSMQLSLFSALISSLPIS